MNISSKHNYLLVIILLFTAFSVNAGRDRVALVVGNSDYQNAPLKNPVNDAEAMAEKLASKGFVVDKLLNADQKSMEIAMRDFIRRLKTETVGLFYFAGHGLEIDGENYLMPVDAQIELESDVRYETVAVGRLLDGMKRAGNNLNLLILDACRNNPYTRSFRSASRGLAEMRPASGTMVLYATEPGNVASDGDGKNGLFTEQLLVAMDKPGLDVEAVFKETALGVNDATSGKQVPWFEGVILGYFRFDNDENVMPNDSALTVQNMEGGSEMKKSMLKTGGALAIAAVVAQPGNAVAEGCESYPYGAGEISYQETAEGPKILATGMATVELDDIDEVNDARMEAELEAKNTISKFFNEEISSNESIENASEKKVKIIQDASGQQKNVSKDKVKKTLKTISSNSRSLLRGVVKLAECYTKGEVVMVSVGLKPETIAAAESATKAIGDSFARQPTTTRESVESIKSGNTAGGSGKDSGGPDSFSRGVDKLKDF